MAFPPPSVRKDRKEKSSLEKLTFGRGEKYHQHIKKNDDRKLVKRIWQHHMGGVERVLEGF